MAPRVGKKQVCSNCHQLGHNTLKCPNGESSRLCEGCFGHITYLKHGFVCYHCRTGGKRVNYCSVCSDKGHNRRTCGENTSSC